MRFAALSLGLVCLGGAQAKAETYVIDDDGGPGVDFTDIPPAIAAAQPADRLVIRAGVYSSFVTDKGITMLGEGSTCTVPTFQIVGLPAGALFAAHGFSVDSIRLEQCAGTVFLEQIEPLAELRIASCQDVRLRSLEIHGKLESPALVIESASNVEIVDCQVFGGFGRSFGGSNGTNGGTAIIIAAGSRVQVALSDAIGGNGGSCDSEWTTCSGGNGGNGITVAAGAELIVSGRPIDDIQGGAAGWNYFWDDYYGWDGSAIANQGSVRYSGADIDGSVNGYTETPGFPDPLLFATLQAGNLHVEVRGVTGGNARLMLGHTPLLPFAGLLVKPLMIDQPRVLWLGVIDSTGSITRDIRWREPWHHSQVPGPFLLQGSVFFAGTTVRTNSAYLLTP